MALLYALERLMFMFYYVCMSIYTPYACGCNSSKELESQVVVSPKTRYLGSELGVPAKSASALNHQTSLQSLVGFLLFNPANRSLGINGPAVLGFYFLFYFLLP